MKTTMRDKVCQLIGKYQYLEDYYKTKAAINAQKSFLGGGFIIRLAEPAQADMCSQFLADLNKLLEEDEAAAAQEDRPGWQVVRGLSGTGSRESCKGGAGQWVKH